MLTIDLNPGNTLSVLRALSNPGNAQRIANVAAESYVDDMLDWIDGGHSFTGRTGQLQQSIGWRSVLNGSSEVYANARYATYVEKGTGIHAGHQSWIIGPKSGRKAIRFNVSGGAGYVIRRRITHKGSQAKPFFFTDLASRGQHMQEESLSVLAALAGSGHGNV